MRTICIITCINSVFCKQVYVEISKKKKKKSKHKHLFFLHIIKLQHANWKPGLRWDFFPPQISHNRITETNTIYCAGKMLLCPMWTSYKIFKKSSRAVWRLASIKELGLSTLLQQWDLCWKSHPSWPVSSPITARFFPPPQVLSFLLLSLAKANSCRVVYNHHLLIHELNQFLDVNSYFLF